MLKLVRFFAFASLALVGCSAETESNPPQHSANTQPGDHGNGSNDNGNGNASGAREVSADGGAHPAVKRVFVTGATYDGNLNGGSQGPDGTDDADAICNALSQAAGIGGTWSAWLTGYADTDFSYPVDRLTSAGPWYLVDGSTVVFPSKADILGHGPAHAIDLDEHGRAVSGDALVWTNTPAAGGPPNTFCNSMTSTSTGNHGVVGAASKASAEWTESKEAPCNERHHLYCFER